MTDAPENLFKILTMDYARKKITHLHLDSGWSFEVLSQKTGITVQDLKEFEAGHTEITPHEIAKLLDAFAYFNLP